MELPGTGYLYTIATLSITYAGFAALIVVFRQIIGGGVSTYDVFVIRSVLMRSFIIAFSAMVPPALALFDLSQSTIWRISSLCAAIPLGVFTLTFQARRSSVTDRPISKWAAVNMGAQALITIFLFMMAFEIIIKPAAGPFVIALTASLLVAANAYLVQIEIMLRGPVERKKRR
jgi:hypothetical protein